MAFKRFLQTFLHRIAEIRQHGLHLRRNLRHTLRYIPDLLYCLKHTAAVPIRHFLRLGQCILQSRSHLFLHAGKGFALILRLLADRSGDCCNAVLIESVYRTLKIRKHGCQFLAQVFAKLIEGFTELPIQKFIERISHILTECFKFLRLFAVLLVAFCQPLFR